MQIEQIAESAIGLGKMWLIGQLAIVGVSLVAIIIIVVMIAKAHRRHR